MGEPARVTPGDTGACPLESPLPGRTIVGADDLLVLSMQKRMVVQYATGESGSPELHLYYGDKEVTFDEPKLFGFGEALAKQSQFRAGTAASWGRGCDWTRVQELLAHLIDQGILERAEEHVASDVLAGGVVRPSPLPPAVCTRPRTWAECETITQELAGRPVELGYLELVVPVFRVAHIALDADGRQVGEANVFPRALRLDAPTTWLACTYPGTRYMVDRPMNVTALKAMRLHWKQMMAALLRIRSAYFRRFPDAAEGWTVGRVERLATLVLSVPTYQIVRCDRPLESGELHPALSSLFRVTDGLRMTMHQMLFVPIGEPTMSPDAPVTSEQIFEYAERNYSFHSETGVCGGPKHMIQEFLDVVLDGRLSEELESFAFDGPVEAALNDMDAAFDYGLYGLQVYAAFFSLWPSMTRAYERLGAIAEAAVNDGADGFSGFRDRIRARVVRMKNETYLATDEWRAHREQVYADMYEQCGRGLSVPHLDASLPEQLAPVRSDEHAAVGLALTDFLRRHFRSSNAHDAHVDAMQACLMDFFIQEQAIFLAACAVQQRLNRMLGRSSPTRPFGSADADVHNLLQGAEFRRLPYLIDELEDALGLAVSIDAHRIELTERHREAAASN